VNGRYPEGLRRRPYDRGVGRERFTGAEYTGCYRACQPSDPWAAPSPSLSRRLTEVVIETLRVSAGSRPNAVAGAIAALLRQDGHVEVQAIGPHAVNQAVKALAVARSYLVDDALDLTAAPSFVKLELQAEERTAVRFEVRAVAVDGAGGRAPVAEVSESDPPIE
jgi:stage V sporulation protein S